MVFDRFDDLRVEAGQTGGGAESAVVHVTAGAARDLRQLAGAQRP